METPSIFGTTINLKSGEYLPVQKESRQLPFGIINKMRTGNGGTYSVLAAPSNDIIITPLRKIIESKFDQRNEFIDRTLVKVIGGSNWKSELMTSRLSIFSNKIYYKFLVIPELIRDFIQEMLKMYDLNFIVNKFILTIDEIHMVFLDSGYRPSLFDAIELYKAFPLLKRRLISATMPKEVYEYFPNDIVYKVHYLDAVKPKVTLQYIKSVKEMLLQGLFKGHFILWNNVQGIYDLIQPGMGLHISSNNPLLPEFEKRGFKNGVFIPDQVNLGTTSSSTGVDFYNSVPAHVHIIVDGSNTAGILNPYVIKQALGRIRNEHLGGTITVIRPFRKPKIKSERIYKAEAKMVIDLILSSPDYFVNGEITEMGINFLTARQKDSFELVSIGFTDKGKKIPVLSELALISKMHSDEWYWKIYDNAVDVRRELESVLGDSYELVWDREYDSLPTNSAEVKKYNLSLSDKKKSESDFLSEYCTIIDGFAKSYSNSSNPYLDVYNTLGSTFNWITKKLCYIMAFEGRSATNSINSFRTLHRKAKKLEKKLHIKHSFGEQLHNLFDLNVNYSLDHAKSILVSFLVSKGFDDKYIVVDDLDLIFKLFKKKEYFFNQEGKRTSRWIYRFTEYVNS